MIASFDFVALGNTKEFVSDCITVWERDKIRSTIQASAITTSPARNRLTPNPENMENTYPSDAGAPAASCLRASAASSVISRISAKGCKLGETNPAENVMNDTFSDPP